MYSSTHTRMIRKWTMDRIVKIGRGIVERSDPRWAAASPASKSNELSPRPLTHSNGNSNRVGTDPPIPAKAGNELSPSERSYIDKSYTYKRNDLSRTSVANSAMSRTTSVERASDNSVESRSPNSNSPKLRKERRAMVTA